MTVDNLAHELRAGLTPPTPVMLVANDRSVMGERTKGRWLNVRGRATTLAMLAGAIGLVVAWGQS